MNNPYLRLVAILHSDFFHRVSQVQALADFVALVPVEKSEFAVVIPDGERISRAAVAFEVFFKLLALFIRQLRN